MHGEPSISDDSALLARWVREGNEDAFAEVVRQYQRLVLGAALRRTGDAELARDVAQQVFATLAAKARTLLSQTNTQAWRCLRNAIEFPTLWRANDSARWNTPQIPSATNFGR